MKYAPKKVKRLAAVITLGIFLLAGGRFYIFWRIKEGIINQLNALQLDGVDVHYKTLDVSSWKKHVRITQLEIEFPTLPCSSGVHIPEINIEGISVISFVLEKSLSFKSVSLDNPLLHFTNNFKLRRWNKEKGGSLNEFKIGQLRIEAGTLELIDSSTCKRQTNASLDLVLNQLIVQQPGRDSMTWSVADARATSLALDLADHFYKVSVKQVAYSKSEKSLRVDSLELAPTLSRMTLAREKGHQIDQLNFILPTLEANGLDVGRKSFSARSLALNFQLNVFRDKRFAIALKKPRLMPVRFLRQLPFHLQIDSIKILPSFISYEEFPEKGDQPGKIFFNDLQAQIHHLSNDSTQDTHLEVTSRFMNAGDLRVNFTFPLKKKEPNTVKGSLTHFSMPAINRMLIPIANMKVESGMMNEMKFQFQYNDSHSKGELEVNYADLKVLSLRKDPFKTTNKFISWLFGAFVKRDIHKSDDRDKRIGEIAWKRDPQKGILNYWWKSVLSGIKAVFNIDKLPGKKQKAKTK